MGSLAFFIRCLAAVMSLFPVRNRVVFLSRQSSTLSLDYRMLRDELASRLPQESVCVCLAAPETQGKLRFALNMLAQLWYARTSKVCIVDGYSPVISIPAKRKGCTVIQLWHALGAVKKFGFQSLDTPSGRSSHEARVACMHEGYDAIVAAGPGAVPAYAEAFGYDQDVVAVTGLPRMDYLLDPRPEADRKATADRLVSEHPFLGEEAPVVLYAPTFRKGIEDDNWLSHAIEDLARAFDGAGVNLVITGHPLQHGFDEALLARYPHLRFVSGAAAIGMLELADSVITDYSAVAFEAAVAGVGVYFYVPDIVEYRRSPGLNIDPVLEFADVAAVQADDVAAMVMAGLKKGADSSFLRYSEAYFEGIAFGSTSRLADLVCRKLA
ncbi:MAG: CDP-glycerol glycerophosphotransferase family protein [Eggerthellaceae bacterium]|nr:CDP-glycerol glycerophosphotransferase family protein [Eggerthellaceae bacterium]